MELRWQNLILGFKENQRLVPDTALGFFSIRTNAERIPHPWHDDRSDILAALRRHPHNFAPCQMIETGESYLYATDEQESDAVERLEERQRSPVQSIWQDGGS